MLLGVFTYDTKGELFHSLFRYFAVSTLDLPTDKVKFHVKFWDCTFEVSSFT